MKDLIKQLTESFGPSGFEERIRGVIRAEVEGLVDEVRVTPLGSLVAVKRGSGGGQRIMLAAHMDEIGVMATFVDEKGFVRFTQIGYLFVHSCYSNRVVFENGVAGVVGMEQLEDASKVATLQQMYIDVGATSREDCPVRVGDPGAFVQQFAVQGRRLVSKAMDDRIGCAILIEVLRRLGETPHELHVAFTTQEETNLAGARTAAYGVDPDMAIAVDVTTTGDTPEGRKMAIELGKGPAVKVQDGWMIAHPQVREMLVSAAERAGVAVQMEVLEGGTTDAAVMQLARGGVPAGCLSVPCRYVHTPSEMVDEGDVEGAVQILLAAVKE